MARYARAPWQVPQGFFHTLELADTLMTGSSVLKTAKVLAFFFQAILRGTRFDRHKNIHGKGSLLTPAQRRKCLTKLFEVFLYSSPGILLDYRLDKAPRLFFVLHFCRNPSKENAIMEEYCSKQHSDSRNLLSEAGFQLMFKIWNTNWNWHCSPAGQHFHWKKSKRQKQRQHLQLKHQNLNVQIMGSILECLPSDSDYQMISTLWSILILTYI